MYAAKLALVYNKLLREDFQSVSGLAQVYSIDYLLALFYTILLHIFLVCQHIRDSIKNKIIFKLK